MKIRVNKQKNKKNDGKDIFDELINNTATKQPRHSVAFDNSHNIDGKKPRSFFNMSGGNRHDSEEDSNSTYDSSNPISKALYGRVSELDERSSSFKELEEENKRLLNLIEYKDYELNKKKKAEELGFDCFSELRQKFDMSLKNLEDKIKDLNRVIEEKNSLIDQLQIELSQKNLEKEEAVNKVKHQMKAQQDQFEIEIKNVKSKLSESSKEIVDGYKQEIQDLVKGLDESEKAKNKLLDEKLKIEEIIDKQIEQVDYWSNKANKLEDELSLRKQLEESVTKNLKKAEEKIRVLTLEKEEKSLWSFKVKFINIEEAKSVKEILTHGTVQTWQSLLGNSYFLRLTYTSAKDKLVKSLKVDADCLGGIIPITESRAAIQWKSSDGKLIKQEVEIDDPEQLLLEIGNITYR